MEILREFKKQLTIFFDELIDQFPEEGDLVVARLFIANQVPIHDLMSEFLHNLDKDQQKIRLMIKNRDDKCLLANSLFNKKTGSKLSRLSKLWRGGRLDKDDKDTIWKWVDTFVFLSDKYTTSLSPLTT